MFFLLPLLFCINSLSSLTWVLGPEKGFVMVTSGKLSSCWCDLTRSVLKPLFLGEIFIGNWILATGNCLCFPQTLSIEKCYATTQQIAKQTKPIETKVRENNSCRSDLEYLGWWSSFWGLSRALFLLAWFLRDGLVILVQSQGIISFLGRGKVAIIAIVATVAKVAMGTGPWAFWSIMSFWF